MEATSYRLCYNSSDKDTRDTIVDLEISFQDPTEEVLKKRINTWLTAIGVNLEVNTKT